MSLELRPVNGPAMLLKDTITTLAQKPRTVLIASFALDTLAAVQQDLLFYEGPVVAHTGRRGYIPENEFQQRGRRVTLPDGRSALRAPAAILGDTITLLIPAIGKDPELQLQIQGPAFANGLEAIVEEHDLVANPRSSGGPSALSLRRFAQGQIFPTP
ncbi:MAG: hypothetical protein ACREGI_05485 [Candidatus Levyibacteriota bacterium]